MMVTFSRGVFQVLVADVKVYMYYDKKLSYRRETARQMCMST